MYKVDTKYLYKRLPFYAAFGLTGLLCLIVIVSQLIEEFTLFNMIDDDAVKSKILLIFIASAIPKIIVPLAFMLVFIVPFVNIRRKVKKIHYLERYGALIRNIPYSMVKTNTVVNGVPIKRIAIEYTLRDGTKTILHSEKRLDHKLSDGDGKVDLLIDPNNESNYYIDFNIPLVDAPKIG